MVKRLSVFLFACLVFCLCCPAQSSGTMQLQNAVCGVSVDVVASLQLKIFRPTYRSVDLVCGTMPTETDTSVIFCAAASFTGSLLDEFRHDNIMGPHVSGGKAYKGYGAGKHYGLFSAAGNHWSISPLPNSDMIARVAAAGGMAFTQHWVIRQGEIYKPTTMSDLTRSYVYRVIANLHDTLCIIESTQVVSYGQFIQSLKTLGVTDALYMDMGAGWNYSFYRDEKGVFHRLHPRISSSRYATNWITFRK